MSFLCRLFLFINNFPRVNIKSDMYRIEADSEMLA